MQCNSDKQGSSPFGYSCNFKKSFRHRREKQKKSRNKRISIRATNLDRLVFGAFYSMFLVANYHDRKEFLRLAQLISIFHFFKVFWLNHRLFMMPDDVISDKCIQCFSYSFLSTQYERL